MGSSILYEGKSTLLRIREEVDALDESVRHEHELDEAVERMERELSIRKKQVNEEVADTIRKRREEIFATFKDEEDKISQNLKKTRTKKERMRNGRVSERITAETSGILDDNDMLKSEAKKIFRQSHTPAFFNSDLFYTLFMPKGLRDYLLCFVAFVILFAAIPVGAYLLIPEPRKMWYLMLIYLAAIVLFGGGYLLIHSKVRQDYLEIVNKGYQIRQRQRKNRKLVKKISRNIEKDKDDSSYGLEPYDDDIADLEQQQKEMNARRREAIRVYDEQTKLQVEREIRQKYEKDLADRQQELTAAAEELKATRLMIKQQTLAISGNYEVYMGKEFVSPTALARMDTLMDEKGLATIGEALDAYKAEKQAK